MDEILTASMEETGTETLDAGFDAGWSQEESPAEALPEGAEETTEAEPETEQEPENSTRESQRKAEEGQTEPQAQPEQEPSPAQPAVFHVKYMDEEKTITAEEAPALIQKGMDYDRIRVKYDEAKPVMEFMSRYARQANMSMAEYLDYNLAVAMIEAGLMPDSATLSAAGINQADAKAMVEMIKAQQALGLSGGGRTASSGGGNTGGTSPNTNTSTGTELADLDTNDFTNPHNGKTVQVKSKDGAFITYTWSAVDKLLQSGQLKKTKNSDGTYTLSLKQ